MFTGIIEQAGKIESLERDANGGRLRVSLAGVPAIAPEIAVEMKLGDSIAVNGCCLTVVEFDSAHFSADLSLETLQRTSFGEKQSGDLVNLERPLAAGARLGGHFVQGHVDGTANVTELTQQGENWWLSLRLPENLRGYVAEKGSIAIDGISLTVARWQNGVASIAVIPYTYAHTNVQSMKMGSQVNIECDILAKYMESLLAARSTKETPSSRLTVDRLVEQGF
ncbi:MAG TPA: riboflavin synthase [Candidatus Acidoferrales bacterium]|jgi:riboflavin synthase|nr:riboflavin synthase [Candidatus Acidoferrales bacterium]